MMKSKFLAALLVVCLILSVSTLALAANETNQLQDAIDNAINGSGVLTLNKDYKLGSYVEINGALKIVGNGHTIEGKTTNRTIRINASGDEKAAYTVEFENVTIINNKGDGRAVETRGGAVTLKLVDSELTTPGTSYSQALTIGGHNQGNTTTVIIDNTKISAGHYGIIFFNKTDMTIQNGSDISGYAALYFKGVNSSDGSKGSEVTVKDSKLSSNNNFPAHPSNTFATVVFGDDNITLNIENSEVIAKRDENMQYPFMESDSDRESGKNCQINLGADTKVISEGTPFFVGDSSNKVTLKDSGIDFIGNDDFTGEFPTGESDFTVGYAEDIIVNKVTGSDGSTYYETAKLATPTPAPVVTPTPAPAAPAAPVAPTATPAPAPRTGDSTNLALWMGLMVISGMVLLGLGKKAKAGK